MIEDREVWQCANVLVKRYGDDAPTEAVLRANAMLEEGDLDGKVVWNRILRAVEELLREAPLKDEQLQ